MKACAFTGHRPQKFPWKYDERDHRCKELKRDLSLAIEQAIRDGYDHFIVGGALGVDMWAAEAVLELKKTYEITLEVDLPFADYNINLQGERAVRQREILNRADLVVVLEPAKDKDAYKERNQYMIDNARRLIAVFDGERHLRSGTAQTVRMAEKADMEIVRLIWSV